MPVMEKQSGGCVEFRQSPNRKNHHERHKSEKFGAFVIGAQLTFMIFFATSTTAGINGNAASVPHRG
jgi:hypothetical protein